MVSARSIAFIANPDKPSAIEAQRRMISHAAQKQYQCIRLETTGNGVNYPAFSQVPDLIVAIGGDGTILEAANISARYQVPILGVNLGRIGFLSEITPDDFPQALLAWETNQFELDRRMMLKCIVNDKHEYYCLNDVLLYKRLFSGVSQIDITINDLSAGTVFGDGMIISTPTGATAYSFSAGGPVIAPGLDAMVITPVCPHSIHARPIVAAADSTLQFHMRTEGCLSVDGRPISDIGKDVCITIRQADISTVFIRLSRQNIYQLIKEKL